MVKDMRYILKRILIGVGIALALMCIKTNVFAKTTYSTAPTSLGEVSSTGTVSYPTMSSLSDFGSTLTFYGRNNVTSQTAYRQLLWYVPINGDGSTTYTIQFTFLQYALWGASYEPLTVYLVDTTRNRVFSCQVDSSRYINETANYTGQNMYNSVYCPSVTPYGDLRVYVAGSMLCGANTCYYGITKLTYTEDTGNSDIVDAIDNGTQATQDQTDTIKDSSIDNNKAESDLSTMNGKTASNGTITQLLTLPITLYQAILNNVNGSCSSYSLGSLLNHNITLPCINLENILGSTLYGIIDILCSGLFILAFRKKMVDIFNHMTSLNDRGNELE